MASNSSSVPNFAMKKVRVFVYDVFGTIADWKTTINQEITSFATLTSSRSNRPLGLLCNNWKSFTKEWIDGYKSYIHSTNEGKTRYISADLLIQGLLTRQVKRSELGYIWSEKDLKYLSNIWNKLEPYADVKPGITRLRNRYINALLSNTEGDLISDILNHSDLNCFDHIFSAERWQSYTPDAVRYLDCCSHLNLFTEEVAVVSNIKSHLNVVKALGLKTVFLQREDYDEEEGEMTGNKNYDLKINDLEELAKIMGC